MLLGRQCLVGVTRSKQNMYQKSFRLCTKVLGRIPPKAKSQKNILKALFEPGFGKKSLTSAFLSRAVSHLQTQEYLHTSFVLLTVSGDGYRRTFVSVNRELPGPPIELCENDKLEVEVTNAMSVLETPVTIHWHGQHQRKTNYMDGVPNLTQCYIQSGEKFTYKFTPNPAGSFMYHSHVGTQMGDGLFGALIVRQAQENDPNSGTYDHDCDTPTRECEFVVIINDWVRGATNFDDFILTRYTAFSLAKPRSSLINGFGRAIEATPPGSSQSAFTPLEVFNVVRGKRYRFRVMNLAAVSCRYEVAVDYHRLTVIATDGYPVEPRVTDKVTLFNGERYDFVLDANQQDGNYWFKVIPIGECSVMPENANVLGIVRYRNVPAIEPSGSRDEFLFASNIGTPINVNQVFPNQEGWESLMGGAVYASELKGVSQLPADLQRDPNYTFYLAMDQLYNDPLYNDPDLYPYNPRTVTTAGTAMFNNLSFVFPHFPLLLYPDDMSLETYCTENSVNQQTCLEKRCRCIHMISIPLDSTVEMFLVNEVQKGKGTKGHPIHMHGYHGYLVGMGKIDLKVLKSEVKRRNEAGYIGKNLINPPRKDTVQVTGGGYSVWRFKADNPGLWFFHCHVETHMLEGQALILKVGDAADFDKIPSNFPTCDGTRNAFGKKSACSGALINVFHVSVLILCLVFQQLFNLVI